MGQNSYTRSIKENAPVGVDPTGACLTRARVFNYIILVQGELDFDNVLDFLHLLSAEGSAVFTSLQDFPGQKGKLVCQSVAAL